MWETSASPSLPVTPNSTGNFSRISVWFAANLLCCVNFHDCKGPSCESHFFTHVFFSRMTGSNIALMREKKKSSRLLLLLAPFVIKLFVLELFALCDVIK